MAGDRRRDHDSCEGPFCAEILDACHLNRRLLNGRDWKVGDTSTCCDLPAHAQKCDRWFDVCPASEFRIDSIVWPSVPEWAGRARQQPVIFDGPHFVLQEGRAKRALRLCIDDNLLNLCYTKQP